MLTLGTRNTCVHVGKTLMAFLALVTCEAFRWLTRDQRGAHDARATMLAEHKGGSGAFGEATASGASPRA